MRSEFDVRVPMRDSITLSANIYHPDVPGQYPAILLRTPYMKSPSAAGGRVRDLVEHGYVVVYSDVRGRGDSDGDFVPYRNDGRDGYDAIEWCAAQSWSNGNIGTMGGSYSGQIQWLTAILQPPHLRAMIATVSPSDPFVESPTGLPTPMHICWNHMTSGRIMQPTDDIPWSEVYAHLPLIEMDTAIGRDMPGWREECSHEGMDDFWREITYQDKFDRVMVPVLHVSGWYDDEQIGTPLNFAGMVAHGGSEHARANQRLLMGPWPHAVNSTSTMGEVNFGPQATIDLSGFERRFLDRWLKNDENGVDGEKSVRLFVMGENVWRDEPAWPLPQTVFTSYYLHSAGAANSRFGNGHLSTDLPEDEPVDRYVYDPTRPVPFITEPLSSQIGGPDDYAATQRRDDVLVYVTDPLEHELEVTGPIRLELYAASTAVDTDFMGMLFDLHPSGFAQRLTDSMVRARFRHGLDRSDPLEPGAVERFEIDLWNTSQRFAAGHRIGLQIASSAFPKYDRNLNTGGSLARDTEMRQAEQSIYHDQAHPSALILPIVPR